MTQVITLASTKGGVGKSSVCTNLAAALAQRGKRVLVIDGDAQGSSTLGLGIRPVEEGGFEAFLLGKAVAAAAVRAVPTTVDLVDLVPATRSENDNDALAERVAKSHVPTSRLQARLDAWLQDGRYDFVLLDTPGTTGAVVDQCLCASDAVLGIYAPESWAALGVATMKRRIADLTADGATTARLIGLVENARTRTAQAAAWKQVIADQETVLGSIRRTQKIPDAQAPSATVKPLVGRSKVEPVVMEFLELADAVIRATTTGKKSRPVRATRKAAHSTRKAAH